MKHFFLYIAAILAASTAADRTVTLPDAFGAPSGAVALAPPEHYTSNGLYEYLDGGADIYMESGMKTCSVRRYGDPKNKNADYEVAVYDMGLPVNAFGLFRQLQEDHVRGIGTESAAQPRRISFWKSSQYAEVLDKSSKPVADSTLAFLAKAVASRMPGDTLMPAEIRLLPEAGKIPGSEQYRKSGFLSRSFLNNVISARYAAATGACTLFVMTCPSDSAAAAGLGIIGREFGNSARVQSLVLRNHVAGCVGCGRKEFEHKWSGALSGQLRKQ
ncbi:MAG: DUF6599 family protein [Chitinivibrionales bacterium]